MIHLAFFDLEEPVETEFMRWYESEHVPSILERRGWERMCGYRCTDGSPLLSLYELDDALPLVPHLSEAPFHSGPFVARGIRNYHARTWRETHSMGPAGWGGEWLNVVTVDIERNIDEFNRWYNDVHVPEILACPGWLSNRRFKCLDGEPRLLAIYELEDDLRPFKTAEWRSAVGWDEYVEHIRGFHGFRVYRKTFDSERP